MDKFLKIKDGFILKNIAGDYIVVPGGKNIVDFKIMLTLNESGAWLWKQMEKGIGFNELTNKFAEEFKLASERAVSDAADFTAQLEIQNLLEKS